MKSHCQIASQCLKAPGGGGREGKGGRDGRRSGKHQPDSCGLGCGNRYKKLPRLRLVRKVWERAKKPGDCRKVLQHSPKPQQAPDIRKPVPGGRAPPTAPQKKRKRGPQPLARRQSIPAGNQLDLAVSFADVPDGYPMNGSSGSHKSPLRDRKPDSRLRNQPKI